MTTRPTDGWPMAGGNCVPDNSRKVEYNFRSDLPAVHWVPVVIVGGEDRMDGTAGTPAVMNSSVRARRPGTAMTFLGVDMGATSTRAVVCDESSHCLGHSRGGGGNIRSSSLDVSQALENVLAPLDLARLGAAVIGVAGAGSARRAEIEARVARGWARVGAPGDVIPVVVTDLEVAHASVSRSGDGSLLLAGTGAVAAQFSQWRIARRCDGMGWLLGDCGSGYWLGRRTLRAVAADLDGRGPRTQLTPAVLVRLGLPPQHRSTQALIGRVDGLGPADVAGFASLPLAMTDDATARSLVEKAADHLVATAHVLTDGPLCLAGGLFTSPRPGAVNLLRERVETVFGVSPLADAPVIGACWLAGRSLGSDIDRRRLHDEYLAATRDGGVL